ncbi:hypothetical protein [Mycoplasmopsis cynos]
MNWFIFTFNALISLFKLSSSCLDLALLTLLFNIDLLFCASVELGLG